MAASCRSGELKWVEMKIATLAALSNAVVSPRWRLTVCAA
jgi:hypothetical protein